MGGRFDIALNKAPKPAPEEKPKAEPKLKVVKLEDTQVHRVEPRRLAAEDDAAPIAYEGTGPTSRNLTIMGPNGYRISIPIRHLNIRPGTEDVYNGERQLVITLPVATAQAILDDIAAGQRRYGRS